MCCHLLSSSGSQNSFTVSFKLGCISFLNFYFKISPTDDPIQLKLTMSVTLNTAFLESLQFAHLNKEEMRPYVHEP
uniref:Uncharacterized protein n=1 Tax=Oryza brachyantha TaxID=4533 RepID=J3NDX0_ORYBR